MKGHDHSSLEELEADVKLLGDLMGDSVAELSGEPVLALVRQLRDEGMAVRAGQVDRDRFAARFAAMDLGELAHVARAFTHWFHVVNAAEEQHRIRVLRRREARGERVVDSLGAALQDLHAQGATAADARRVLGQLFIMPVLTAHPTEARRRTTLEHLAVIAGCIDRLDDPRVGGGERDLVIERLRVTVGALYSTEESRAHKMTAFDEISSALHVFDRTLLDVTPQLYRDVEDSLHAAYPGEAIEVPAFFRWGTWIGGDRDGNPNVTSDVTRAALDRQRTLILQRYIADANQLLRELSVSSRRLGSDAGLAELRQSLERDRERFATTAARAAMYTTHEPWREKLWYVRARLEATLHREDGAYPRVSSYSDDLEVLARTLRLCGHARLAHGTLRDCIRRAQVFGFHLASLDLRQHSAVHERAVAELLAAGGVGDYAAMDDDTRVRTLAPLLERADLSSPVARADMSPATRELLGTLDMVGRARREMGSAACERYVVSFTSSESDLLEVLFLGRAAQLAPTELRPVPLLEQLEDLENGGKIAERMLDLAPIRAALRGDLEVMIGYSDAGKQIGYFASTVALRRAQVRLAGVARERGATLTIFHGRGGAIGRGGGPASRAIVAQPPEALAGRIRVTEQGETITARYARPEIARRDLQQLVSAVMLATYAQEEEGEPSELAARANLLDRAAGDAQAAYARLLSDEDRMARYAVDATPIQQVSKLNLGSRPASRRAGFSFADLRAIPWVFSWNQSRHGIPGWFGLGTALDTIVAQEGIERARQLYREWPFFRALINNAQLALARADIDVAEHYARLASPDVRAIFTQIREEHARTVSSVLEVVDRQQLLGNRPHLVSAVKRRNPYVDVLSHTQIELLRRLQLAVSDDDRDELRGILFITINGIAAGLQTAG
ncbi:MAG TPA: phosphoenolpyruvate carboxylase [Kofleriaceae bacterium]|nr:phosphoenolpyruvate carboxylase [Kofleriaceae bacterium]